jgi:hypothetical protein
MLLDHTNFKQAPGLVKILNSLKATIPDSLLEMAKVYDIYIYIVSM